MVITCGTGNTNFAANANSVVKRIGGLTPYSGDVLGAMNIAGLVCSAAVRSQDGRDYPSLLEKNLPDAFKLPSVKDLSNLPLSPESIQIILEKLFTCADQGDGKALEIVWTMVKEILDIVELFGEDEPFKPVLEGPVFKQEYPPFMKMLRTAIEQKYQA